MLKFFKRPEPPPRRLGTAAAASRRPAASAALPPEPPPLPEVTEGNQESDWALWEDSVAFQDSQQPSAFSELQAVRVRGEPNAPDERSGHDPYARVRKHE